MDDDLQPTGDWHTAVTWPVGTQNLWKLIVDQLGRALVLAFVFPPTLGSPPDPSVWDFSARWMGGDGPISEPFMPVVPTYTGPDGRVFFADWDIIRPLREGGFAMYRISAAGPGNAVSVGMVRLLSERACGSDSAALVAIVVRRLAPTRGGRRRLCCV